MSSLADLPELVGFFSYSREDDAGAFGALSALRERIQHELRAQLGRTARTFRIWQDKEAIPSGSLWESEIKNSVAQAVFFIPIITPTVIASPFCRFELDAFLAREAALGRSDLVFPILYIHVPALEDNVRRQNDAVLSLIAKRQYVDWREFRHLDTNSTEVKRAVERFCGHIRDALNKPWLSPEERVAQEKAAALQRAEDERKRQEAEAQRKEEEARKKAAAVREREQADEERRQREAEAERRRAEKQRLLDEAQAKRRAAEEQRRAEKEERRRLQRSEARPLWPPSRPALAAGSVICLLLIGGIGVWLAAPPAAVSVKPSASNPLTPSAPVSPAPAPAAPTQQAANTPLSAAQERALKPGDTFKECKKCPQMMVVPPGSFTMGSPANEPGRSANEGPQHTVTLAQQFAVGQFELTFDEWDACVAAGGCNDYKPFDWDWGYGRQPAINVSWDDAKAYVAWLAKAIGKPYRLLSEAEYEYATRAGTQTAYPWGNDIGKNNANCNGCGSQWDNNQTAPVGSFAANGFGLYDMVGNVLEWTQDCDHGDYDGAPAHGSPWAGGDCRHHVVRGGSWNLTPGAVRSAYRTWLNSDRQSGEIGFRVGRTLIGP